MEKKSAFYVNNVLIKPSLHNNIITVVDYCYNYLAKQHVSAIIRLAKQWCQSRYIQC